MKKIKLFALLSILLLCACNSKTRTSNVSENISQSVSEISKETTADGKSITTLSDGTIIEKSSDGTTIEKSSDGTTKEIQANGTIIETATDGTITETKKDGTVILAKTDGSKIEIALDGSIKEIQAPTEGPTQAPVVGPTQAPVMQPTQTPTQEPTQEPTQAPTQAPTEAPTAAPTQAPARTLKACNANDNKVDAIFNDYVAGKITAEEAATMCLVITNDRGFVRWSDGVEDLAIPCHVVQARFQKVTVTGTVSSANFLTFGVAWEYTDCLTVKNADGTKTCYSGGVVSMPY